MLGNYCILIHHVLVEKEADDHFLIKSPSVAAAAADLMATELKLGNSALIVVAAV